MSNDQIKRKINKGTKAYTSLGTKTKEKHCCCYSVLCRATILSLFLIRSYFQSLMYDLALALYVY
jgi:hypothetical protein